MDEVIKKMLRKLRDDVMHGRTYLYATNPITKDKYRFSFPTTAKRDIRLVRNLLKFKGLKVKTWRPNNAK